ncbi:hypothetical protein GOV09_02875 [Candidatus Woesearchaeota archaeon]|nr:hypothetical protein [Candidatus Woesearchaeota archaeon]
MAKKRVHESKEHRNFMISVVVGVFALIVSPFVYFVSSNLGAYFYAMGILGIALSIFYSMLAHKKYQK